MNIPEYVWIGEAYHNNERVERVVHLTEDDAHADIHVLADGRDVDYITVEKERLHTGQVESLDEVTE